MVRHVGECDWYQGIHDWAGEESVVTFFEVSNVEVRSRETIKLVLSSFQNFQLKQEQRVRYT